VPSGVTTWTLPVFAPAGTVAEICDDETTVKAAGVPSKVTLVASVRLVPKDFDRLSRFVEGGQGRYEWAETHVEAEDCAHVAGPATGSRPIQVAVRVLDQRALRVGTIGSAEAVEDGYQGSLRTDLEYSAVPAKTAPNGYPIEVPVGGLDYAADGPTAVGRVEETVQDCHSVGWVGSAVGSCPIEVTVCALDQCAVWRGTVGVGPVRTKLCPADLRSSGALLTRQKARCQKTIAADRLYACVTHDLGELLRAVGLKVAA